MTRLGVGFHGYGHPQINRALHDQIDNMAHVMFGGLTHRPAVELATRLVDITPDPLDVVFFADSGSVAVEVAIKMAIQYWAARGQPTRQRLMTVRGGYHGDTFGAMAVCDPVTGMHGLFADVLPQPVFAERGTRCADGNRSPRSKTHLPTSTSNRRALTSTPRPKSAMNF